MIQSNTGLLLFLSIASNSSIKASDTAGHPQLNGDSADALMVFYGLPSMLSDQPFVAWKTLAKGVLQLL